MAACACGRDWVVESCQLSTGLVRSVLHPLSMDWSTELNGVGQGTITLATKDVLIRDVWPDLTSVYISRVSGDGASPDRPVCEFAGIVEQVNATEAGTTQVGLKSIESYLDHRTIRQDLTFTGRPQTEIGASLVDLARAGGIPLLSEAAPSDQSRDRAYRAFNRKVVGEAVKDLTEVINGVDWELSHERVDGLWQTSMIFRDRVGQDRDLILHSDRELSAYSLNVNAQDHATLVDAIGSGEEEDQLIATVQDPSGVYPQFDATPAWKDVTRLTTLYQHAEGYLETYREPRATPTFSITGLQGRNIPSPLLLRLGDTTEVHVDFGAITYHGRARIISQSWSLGVDEPLTRSYETLPLDRASQSVLNQVPGETCRECR